MHRGKRNARTPKRAHVLLKVAGGWTANEIAEAFDVSPSTVANVRRRFREGGVESVLHDKRQERRTAQDCASQLRLLAYEVYPDAQVICVVQDNLNLHGPAALYATFPPEEARWLRQRFEFYPTPKHRSWLNLAEIEISILTRDCLGRPCPDLDTLCQRAALEAERNAAQRTITWPFTTVQARERLHRLYPDPNIQLD